MTNFCRKDLQLCSMYIYIYRVLHENMFVQTSDTVSRHSDLFFYQFLNSSKIDANKNLRHAVNGKKNHLTGKTPLLRPPVHLGLWLFLSSE